MSTLRPEVPPECNVREHAPAFVVERLGQRTEVGLRGRHGYAGEGLERRTQVDEAQRRIASEAEHDVR